MNDTAPPSLCAATGLPDVASVREALRAVVDPENGANIVDLGLVYGIEVAGRSVRVTMTLTSPACPLGGMIVDDVEAALRALVPADCETRVDLTWDPPWDPARMSAAARARFGW